MAKYFRSVPLHPCAVVCVEELAVFCALLPAIITPGVVCYLWAEDGEYGLDEQLKGLNRVLLCPHMGILFVTETSNSMYRRRRPE